MDSKEQEILDLLELKPRGWYRKYQNLMVEVYGVERLVDGPEHKGYNEDTKRGTRVAYLDPSKYDFYWLTNVEPIRYLRGDECED